ncbi:hypothetical protein OSB04_016685 [Centaurea solstitialis]|uniref:TIR domain-containing protein n=1 Tax=Centaurea solstitialis TaxID=347529 RepID=A0AA38TDB7_9ASTR|nr:hypothetical protein OSB04_016685 [Centaurea solstitialis]
MTGRDSWEGIELKGGTTLKDATCRALGCPHVHNQKLDLLVQPPIASSSSRTIGDSSWDVYLSLKEFDDDYFGDYLRDALYRARLTTPPAFSIQRVSPSQARASIIIFSESYLSSSHHLDELLEILELRRNTGHFVLPVFYHLEPSYIIEHRKHFLLQWFELGSKESMKKVEWWCAALMEVANMPNIYFSRWSRNDDDTASIREIVGILQHALLNGTSRSPNPAEDTQDDKSK